MVRMGEATDRSRDYRQGVAGGETQASIERYVWEYNHDRPHQSLGDRTPREAFLVQT